MYFLLRAQVENQNKLEVNGIKIKNLSHNEPFFKNPSEKGKEA